MASIPTRDVLILDKDHPCADAEFVRWNGDCFEVAGRTDAPGLLTTISPVERCTKCPARPEDCATNDCEPCGTCSPPVARYYRLVSACEDCGIVPAWLREGSLEPQDNLWLNGGCHMVAMHNYGWPFPNVETNSMDPDGPYDPSGIYTLDWKSINGRVCYYGGFNADEIGVNYYILFWYAGYWYWQRSHYTLPLQAFVWVADGWGYRSRPPRWK